MPLYTENNLIQYLCCFVLEYVKHWCNLPSPSQDWTAQIALSQDPRSGFPLSLQHLDFTEVSSDIRGIRGTSEMAASKKSQCWHESWKIFPFPAFIDQCLDFTARKAHVFGWHWAGFACQRCGYCSRRDSFSLSHLLWWSHFALGFSSKG